MDAPFDKREMVTGYQPCYLQPFSYHQCWKQKNDTHTQTHTQRINDPEPTDGDGEGRTF